MTWFNEPSSIHIYKEVTNIIVTFLKRKIKFQELMLFGIENIRQRKVQTFFLVYSINTILEIDLSTTSEVKG